MGLQGFLGSIALVRELSSGSNSLLMGDFVDYGKKFKLGFSMYPEPRYPLLLLSPTIPWSSPTPPCNTLIVAS